MKKRSTLGYLLLIAGFIFVFSFMGLLGLHISSENTTPWSSSLKVASILTLLYIGYESFLFLIAGGADDK